MQLRHACQTCRYVARLYSSQALATAVKSPAAELEEDILSAKRRKSKAVEGPVLDDLLALRPMEFQKLRPPNLTNRKSAWKVEWYQQQFEKAVTRVETAFTLKQLKKLQGLLQRLGSSEGSERMLKEALPRGKTAIASYIVWHPAGWNWPTPEDLRTRIGVDQTETESLPDTTEVVTLSHRDLYLMYQNISAPAAKLQVKLDISTPRQASSSTPIEVRLRGPQEGVTEMQKIVKNATKAIGHDSFAIPPDVSLPPSLIQAVALQTSTYVEQSPEDQNTLLIWRYEKKQEQSNEAVDLLNAACAKFRAEAKRTYFSAAESTEADDAGYHLVPTYLAKAPSAASVQPGASGLFGRLTKISSEFDRMGLGYSATPSQLQSLSNPTLELSDALLTPLRPFDGTLSISVITGQLVFPLPILNPDNFSPATSFEPLVNASLSQSRPSFVASTPPSFLSFESGDQQPFDYAEDATSSTTLIDLMGKYTYEGAAQRKLTYAPLRPRLSHVMERIEAAVSSSSETSTTTFFRVVKMEAAIFRPDQDVDLLFVAEKRIELPELSSSSSEDSKSSAKLPVARQIQSDEATFALIDNRHARTSTVHSVLPTMLRPIDGAEWQLVKSYQALPAGEQSTRLQLHASQVLNGDLELAKLVETAQGI